MNFIMRKIHAPEGRGGRPTSYRGRPSGVCCSGLSIDTLISLALSTIHVQMER
jgi:hypothetical protein